MRNPAPTSSRPKGTAIIWLTAAAEKNSCGSMPIGRLLGIVPKKIKWQRKWREKVTDESHFWQIKNTDQLVHIVRSGFHGNVLFSEIRFKNGTHQTVRGDYLSFVGVDPGSLASLARQEPVRSAADAATAALGIAGKRPAAAGASLRSSRSGAAGFTAKRAGIAKLRPAAAGNVGSSSRPRRSAAAAATTAAIPAKKANGKGRLSGAGGAEPRRNESSTAGVSSQNQYNSPSHFIKKTRHFYCEHNKRRTLCVLCGGQSLCIHGRQKIHCKQCRPKRCKSFCKHGRQKSRCKDCNGVGICEHKRDRYRCKLCMQVPRNKN